MNKEYFENIMDETSKEFAYTTYSTYSLKDAMGDTGDWED